MNRISLGLLLVSAATPASAGDKPLYQPAPAWVKPAPALPAKPADGTPSLLLLDQQQRFADGQVWVYLDAASRIDTPQALNVAGTLALPWQPDDGDLIVHRVEIVRDGQTIDALARKDRFTVLRREGQLEKLQMNGILTATMNVEGLRVGDVLRAAFSITRKDPSLGGAMQSSMPLVQAPSEVGFGRLRLVWPASASVRWRIYADAPAATETTAGGERELVMTLPLPKPATLPDDTPPAYRKPPLLDASTFSDWRAVSRTMAPLYETEGLIPAGSPLAAEVSKIAAASPDPRARAAAALRLVQDEVRYLYRGMQNGNYIPQKPADTWVVRYGDCKAKTLLLLAILRSLGIEAEAVTASLEGGAAIPARLPMPGAFDHVLVRATIDAKPLWLDGTGAAARLVDLDDTPPLRWVLPLRAEGSDLVELAPRPAARPDVRLAYSYDNSAGIDLPARYTVSMMLRGASAALVAQLAQAPAAQRDEFVDKVMGDLVESDVVATRTLGYDKETGLARIAVTGLTSSLWTRDGRRRQATIDRTISRIAFKGDRARPAWSAIPVATGDPETLEAGVSLILPSGGAGYTLEGDRTLDTEVAGRRIVREADFASGRVRTLERMVTSGRDIPAAEAAAQRARLSALRSKTLKVRAPTEVPTRWEQAADARAAGRLAPLVADFDRAARGRPQDASVLEARGYFLGQVYDDRGAIAAFDRAIAIEPTVDRHLSRAYYLERVGDATKAEADFRAALALDPESTGATSQFATFQARRGKLDAALETISRASDDEEVTRDRLETRASMLSDAGRTDEAVAIYDELLDAKPSSARYLNGRCWARATGDVDLPLALKDCTRAVELGNYSASALDSRALVHFRMGKLEAARADVDAALGEAPEQAGSRYLRALIRKASGDAAGAAADVRLARSIDPQVARDYKRMGFTL